MIEISKKEGCGIISLLKSGLSGAKLYRHTASRCRAIERVIADFDQCLKVVDWGVNGTGCFVR
jgi:hypothetical protein